MGSAGFCPSTVVLLALLLSANIVISIVPMTTGLVAMMVIIMTVTRVINFLISINAFFGYFWYHYDYELLDGSPSAPSFL